MNQLVNKIRNAKERINRMHVRACKVHGRIALPHGAGIVATANLSPIDADASAEAVIYHVPGTRHVVVLFLQRGSEPIFVESLAAARRAIAERIRAERIDAKGLKVVIREREWDADRGANQTRWLFGELESVEHPSVARYSRYTHTQRALVKLADGTTRDVRVTDVLICDSHLQVHELLRTQQRIEALQKQAKELERGLPHVWDTSRATARKKGIDVEDVPMDAKYFAREVRAQKARIARRTRR